MHRRLPALIAVLFVATFAGVALAEPDCVLVHCVYLPAARADVETGTPTDVLPTVTPSPTVTPKPDYCQLEPDLSTPAPDFPIRVIVLDYINEVVTLRNLGTETIDLTDWQMCSTVTKHRHPLSGVLSSGEDKSYKNLGSPIWTVIGGRGALYNPQGQLISYL